jgi:DGQHR domain-containing protein
MLTVRALQAEQGDTTLYVTSLTTGQLRQLRESGKLDIETFDPARPTGRQGYQRELNPKKVKQIADFVSRSREEPGADVLLPILPTALVLNCRPAVGRGRVLQFNDKTGELLITDRAILYAVDGQHRIEGLTASTLGHTYQIPTIVVDGLGIVQEAAQFLTINSKQTRVRPDLQLRVLYNFEQENTQRLVDLLRLDDWKLEAQALAIALNDRNESPWRNLVRRPNETTPGWKPMREAGFIDTLRFICEPRGPGASISTPGKEEFLIEYWEAIRQTYPDAFRQDTGRGYHICRTMGTGVFNTLASCVLHLRSMHPRQPLAHWIRRVARRWPLRHWARRTGRFSGEAARHSSYELWATHFARTLEPRLDIIDQRALTRLRRRNLASSDDRVLTRAERLLRPIGYRRFGPYRGREEGQRGCYCLIRFRTGGSTAYIGKADNVGQRLADHTDYDMYNYATAASSRELEALEMALYHLVRTECRENQNHPPPQDACPFC